MTEIPPTEFCIFHAGWNDTDKGRYLFDAAAAKTVMTSFAAQGVDRVIDLEHLSLDDKALNYDPDARGWAKLELRPDGSLWAVGVTWTPDGAARLSDRRQRYISPTFLYEPTTRRVTKIWNMGLVAQPATFHAQPLVAASEGSVMNLELMAKVAAAMGLAPDAPLADIIATFAGAVKDIQDAASGDAAPDSAADVPVSDDAAVAMADPAPAAAAPAAGAPAAKPEDKKAAMAASARLMRLSGKPTLVEVVEDVETWRRSHLELETERQSLAAERATLESAERRKLCTQLVSCGAEFPSTIWADDKSKALKVRWTKMDIAELRSHVADQMTARGGKRVNLSAPSTQSPSGLSPTELAICKETGCDPEIYASLKSQREGTNR